MIYTYMYLVLKDTVVALAALADFASLIIGPSSERNIEVTVATDTVNRIFYPITDETAILLQSYEVSINHPRSSSPDNISSMGGDLAPNLGGTKKFFRGPISGKMSI